MPRTGLRPEELRTAVLDAAEATIRRHGIEKSRLTDVARSMGVNHALLYRLFPDKAALMEAVSERWLTRTEQALEAVVRSSDPAPRRLSDWFLTLHALKRQKVLFDPELFSAFQRDAAQARPFVRQHLETSLAQLTRIVEDGQAVGEWPVGDPRALAQTLFEATLAYHHPQMVLERIAEDRSAALEALLGLLLRGLRPVEHGGGT